MLLWSPLSALSLALSRHSCCFATDAWLWKILMPICVWASCIFAISLELGSDALLSLFVTSNFICHFLWGACRWSPALVSVKCLRGWGTWACSRWTGTPGTNASQPESFIALPQSHWYLLGQRASAFLGSAITCNMGWSQSCDSPPPSCTHEHLKNGFFPTLHTTGINILF